MLKPMKHMGHTRDLRHNNDIKINKYKIYAQTYRVGHTRDLGHDNDIKTQ